MKIIGTLLRIFAGVFTLGASCGDVNAQQGGLQSIDVVRVRRRIDKLVPATPIQTIAGGHKWIEGPVWNRKEVPALARQSG